MTINSEIRRAGPFVGTGVTTRFPFVFKVFRAEDLRVVSADADGVETSLELDFDYTVELNPDQNTNPGGSIVTTVPLAIGLTLTATSALEYLQPVDLTNQSGFYPRVINDGLDRLTILSQQLFERLGRSLVFPLSEGQVGEVPGVGRRAGAVLAFDEYGAPIVGPSITDVDTVVGAVQAIGTVASNIEDVNTVSDNVGDVTFIAAVYYGPSAEDPATRRDGSPLHEGDMYFNMVNNRLRVFDGLVWGETAAGSVAAFEFTGDGEETEFELGMTPRAKSNTQVYLDGEYQSKDSYSLVGEQRNVLAFNDPPPAGVHIEVVVMSTLPISPLTAEELIDLQGLLGNALQKGNNLSEVTDALASRTNLGLDLTDAEIAKLKALLATTTVVGEDVTFDGTVNASDVYIRG